MGDSSGYLSDEERAFLRELFADEPAADPMNEPAEPIQLQPVGLDRDRLLKMLTELHAELVASDGEHKYRFRLEDASGGAVRVAPPQVIDNRGGDRHARVRPALGELRLLDEQGLLREPRILDLSTTGLALSAGLTQAIEVGQRLEQLRLYLPDRPQPLALHGRIVRMGKASREAAQLLAVQFEGLAPAVEATLRSYVFQRYAP